MSGTKVLDSGIADAVSVQKREHEFLRDMLLLLRIKADCSIPADKACNTYRVLLSSIIELDAEMRQHIRLEEDVIFQRDELGLAAAATAASRSIDYG